MLDGDMIESLAVGRRLAQNLRTELASAALADPEAGTNTCVIPSIHRTSIETARLSLLAQPAAADLAEVFKVLSDPTRIRILSALAASELCVCDLGALLGMGQSALSHQLALLRSARVAKSRRDGKTVWYSLDDDHVSGLLALVSAHVAHGTRVAEAGMPE
ncbi:MAG: metalloregulator ArsR/SmtB family transcription factor [Spirochaetota bacterium]